MSSSLQKSPRWIPSRDYALFFLIKDCAILFFSSRDVLKCTCSLYLLYSSLKVVKYFVSPSVSSQTFASGWREEEE